MDGSPFTGGNPLGPEGIGQPLLKDSEPGLRELVVKGVDAYLFFTRGALDDGTLRSSVSLQGVPSRSMSSVPARWTGNTLRHPQAEFYI